MLKVYAGGVPGPLHRCGGSQDFYHHVSTGSLVVAAVADGAGSLRRSAWGAQTAAVTAAEHAAALLAGGDLHPSLMKEAVSQGVDRARDVLLSRDDAEETGCTLTVGALHEDGTWAACTVGDAFTVVSTADRHVLVTEEPCSDFVNITHLLTSRTFTPVACSGDGAGALALASDGLWGVSTSGRQPAPGFWEPVLARACGPGLEVEALLRHMEDREMVEDDTTLLVVAPTREG